MNFSDYSPPTSPSLAEQQDAFRKGLGRARQWAEAGRLADELLLRACLTDHRYDTDVEDPRADWLWQIIATVDAKQRFRVPLLHALHGLTDEYSAIQLCGLGLRYAATGDEAFRARLYEIVESRPFADYPFLGDEEILELDGPAAFIFVARARGKEISAREWEWHDGCLVDEAIERLGEIQVRELLNNTKDLAIRRFGDAWNRNTRHRAGGDVATPRGARREYLLPVSDVLLAARNAHSSVAHFRGWGMHSDEPALEVVLSRLREATEVTELIRLLRVFSNRALPRFDPRLIELCQHPDSNVRHWAYNALELNSHALVREFALQRLEAGDHRAIGLLTNNYQSGDEDAILSQINLRNDAFDIHVMMLDIIQLLEKNDDADPSQLGVVAYALTPCASCRMWAVRHLVKHQAAPDWLLAECRFDSDEDSRNLAEAAMTEPKIEEI